MGYSTYFEGTLKFNKPITEGQEALLKSIQGDNYDYRGGNPFSVEIPEDVYYIDFEITGDKLGIQHNGREKSYHTVEQVAFIVNVMKSRYPDFALKGSLLAQGEEVGDIWKLVIRDGRAVREEIDLKDHPERKVVEKMQAMCEESLSPELFERWMEVKESLEKTRKINLNKGE